MEGHAVSEVRQLSDWPIWSWRAQPMGNQRRKAGPGGEFVNEVVAFGA